MFGCSLSLDVGILNTQAAARCPSGEAVKFLQLRDEFAPSLLVRQVLREDMVGIGARLERLAQQVHPRFLGRAARLAVIAGLAGRNQVLPRVLAPTVPWEDMVERQVLRLLAAVLTGEAVAHKDLAS